MNTQSNKTSDEILDDIRVRDAAQDMLAALEAVVHSNRYGRFGSPDFPAAIGQARAAIAKAKGSAK